MQSAAEPVTDSQSLEAEADPASDQAAESSCNFESVPLPIGIRWAGLSDAVHELAADGQTLTVELESNTDKQLTVELTAHVVLDDLRFELPFAPIVLTEGQTKSADLDLSAHANKVANLQFSGRVRVGGTVDDGLRVIPLPNRHIYMHEDESGQLLAYDKQRMIDAHGGGDLHNTAAAALSGVPEGSYLGAAGVGVVTEATGEESEDDA